MLYNYISIFTTRRAAVFDNAKYIKAREHAAAYSLYDPAPLFRKEINIEGNIGRARIFVQAPGFAEFYINGRSVTEDRFISPISDYRKIRWYNIYDVTTLLRKGKNALCVIAGNGFFNESFESAWHFQRAPWRDEPQILVRLELDGVTVAVSDQSWKCSRDCSPIIYNHLRSGEYFDARRNDDSWLYAGYDDSDWQNAIEAEMPKGAELRPVSCQPIRECERIMPVKLEKTDRGYTVDFGVTMSGYIDVTLTAERGREIRFLYAEELDPEGLPKHNGMDKLPFYAESPFMCDKLIASGGVDRFKPHFTYHGFRYVIIEGAVTELMGLCAHFVHQDVARTSDFCAGNEVLNYIYHAGIRSTYSNMFWSLTDCPTREKLGWANDAQASVEQTLINLDIVPLYEKWFEDLKSSMCEDGRMPGIIPSPDWGFSYGPVCDCLLYEMPYRIYLYTGNSRMLVDAIPYFERYIKYLEEGIRSGARFHLGDWMDANKGKLIPREFVWEFYLLKAWKITAFAYDIAKRESDAKEIFKQKRAELLQKYTDDDGRCVLGEQSAVAMLLTLECDEYQRPLSEQIVEIVLRDQLRITCGMVGVQYLYEALAGAGRADLAYRMITESDPGYKTWYEAGATTLWEQWDGTDEGSHNHHMFSGVISWFYKFLLGIAPKEKCPAFDEVELEPCFIKEIGFVKGYMQTVKGKIDIEWKYCDGKFVYTVHLPSDVKAYFRGKRLLPGENQFIIESED